MCVQEVTELKDSHTATDTQLPTATSTDLSRTPSELHHCNDELVVSMHPIWFLRRSSLSEASC